MDSLWGKFGHSAAWVLLTVDSSYTLCLCCPLCWPFLATGRMSCQPHPLSDGTVPPSVPHHWLSECLRHSSQGTIFQMYSDALCFFKDLGYDANKSSPSLFLVLVEPQSAGLWVKTSMNCEEFLRLDISGIYVSCGQLSIPGEYLMTHRAYLLMAQILFLPFSWLLNTCLTFWMYLATVDLLASWS